MKTPSNNNKEVSEDLFTFHKPRGKEKGGKNQQFVFYVYEKLKTMNKELTKVIDYIHKEKDKELLVSIF
jgi:hypothetical protein